MTTREATIALNLLPRVGPVRVRRLIEALGSASAILQASSSTLCKIKGIGRETATMITHWEDHVDLSAELQEAQQRGIRIITQEDPLYPSTLSHIYDPPLALYVWGELLEKDKHALAVVGSRRTTHYGRDCARKLSAQLAQSGFSILSGLARGIDAQAHQGAIESGGRTIAVIGSGLAQLYPPEHMKLAEQIADGHGAVVSEFPLQLPPDKRTFPMRNRIVAAWSSGILVVECPKWSGSIITANLGSEMGKTVYAVPGPIDQPSSAGCNQLIRDGATLVTSAHDILDDMEALPLKLELELQPSSTPLPELDAHESTVLQTLEATESSLDQIVTRSQLPVPIVISTLLKLEMKRLVRQLPGPRYLRRIPRTDE
ncbi:DNA-processing protein DprA [Rubritalea tangerina]|uniref:DNA-processing protein DprA n=1 Tax=Rubritalea tangerina TaxID=430798 RepID=A0ABW4ZEN6_9BACT